MREIVHIQIGECGNSIGNAFWTQIGKEHMILNNGKFDENKEENNNELLNRINTYYNHDGKRYIPRACLIDLDPTSLDVIKASSIGSLFKPDNIYFGSSGCDGNWMKGYYSEGAEAIDQVMNIIRKESECCDLIEGFQLVHSISSGTGGGMGSLILRKIRDNYLYKLSANFSVFPSTKSDIYMETMNATMSVNQLIDNSDLTYVIDNNALYNIIQNVLKQKEPKYSDMNWLVSLLMAGITAPYRFDCNENNMRKICMNLVPFPRLHFLLCSHAPLYGREDKSEHKLSVEQITDEIWSVQNCFADVEFGNGKYLSSMCCYRGSKGFSYASNMDCRYNYSRYIDRIFFMNGFIRNNKIYSRIPNTIIDLCSKYIPYNVCVKQEEFIQSMYEYEYQICRMKDKTVSNDKLDNLVSWIPNNVTSICVEDNMGLQGTMIANTTSVNNVFYHISEKFIELHKQTGRVQNLKVEGMDGLDFGDASNSIKDLMTEYQDKQDVEWGDHLGDDCE
eukprot:457501_1